jgi:competence protein ComEC
VQTSAVQPRPQRFALNPLAQLAVAFALGVVCATYLPFRLAWLLTIAVAATLLAATALLITRKRRRLATALVLFAMLFIGATLASIEKNRIPHNQLRSLIEKGSVVVGEPVELTGVLERDPEIAPDRLYLQLRLERVRSRTSEIEAVTNALHQVEDREASGVVMLLALVPGKASELLPAKDSVKQEFDQLDLRYGARIRVMTLLERTDSFRNPGVSSFTEYLDRNGYDASGFVKSPLLIERLDNTRIFLPLRWLYEWRRRLQTEIDLRFSNDTAGVLDAALLGNRYNLSRATSERFREGGTFHVLVISGLHITFLGSLVFLIVRRFTGNAGLQFLLSVGVLWAYTLAVGAEASVVRAALMFTIVLLGPLVSRRASSLNALGGTALALMVLRPSNLLDPSFQLTFGSVLAIVVFGWPLLKTISEIGAWHPTRETPHPPAVAQWFGSFCESLFWSERQAKRDLERANYSYRLFKTPLAAKLERLHLQRLVRYVFAAVVVSVSVQLVLLPLLIIYFHRLSFASFALNIGVSLLMAVEATVAAIALLVAQLNAKLAAPLISLTNSLNWLMVHSVDPFSRIGMASIRLPEYSGLAQSIYVLYYLPLTSLAFQLARWRPLDLPRSKRRRNLAVVFAQILALVVIVFHPYSSGMPTGKLRVDFLDVGQGDSVLVTFPDNTTLLIDGGGRPGPFQSRRLTQELEDAGEENFERDTRSIGESVVSEYLWWRGLDRVDYILATHADADHIDGLNDVARNFSVGSALVARTPHQDEEYQQFSQTLSARGIPVRIVGAGDVLRFGDVTGTVLWPAPLANTDAASGNNDSIVLRLQFGNRTLLLTGDVEMAGERGILLARENLDCDVIKVAHHGSRTSSIEPFVIASRAHFAVISVGQTSIFGHPNAEVVKRWSDSGAKVLTTGQRGTVTVLTNGRDLAIESFVK